MPNFTRIVSDAYQEILERVPDPGGLAHFNERMNQGLSEAELREALLRSEEYAQKNPPPGSMALRVDGNRFVDPRGNEGFKSFSEAWEVGVYQLVKDELRRHGFSDRLVATNTQDPALESQLDYITRHAPQARRAGAKPILVNEYAPLPSSEVIRQVRRARRFGTHFLYWRGDHGQSEWESTLAQLETFAASGRATAPMR